MDIDPQVIIVFLAMAASGLKAAWDWWQQKKNPQIHDEDLFPDNEGPAPAEQGADFTSLTDQLRETARKARAEMEKKLVEAVTEAPVAPKQEKATPFVAVAPQPKPQARSTRAPLKSQPVPVKKPHPTGTQKKVRHLLSSPTAARQGLLFAEIIGPPKALRKDE